MRIIITSDLHYNISRSKRPTETVAEEICRRGGDILILVGDSAGADLKELEAVFTLFEPFEGARLAVAGNHELWTHGREDSLHRYENEIATICSRHGVHYLDTEPFIQGNLAIVGNVGWYDFSFRPSVMKIPLRFYQHKVAPGAADHIEKHRHLLEAADDVIPAVRQVSTRWMDGEHVKLPFSDVDFTHRLVAKLRRHLQDVEKVADRIIAAVHHLPFAELLPRSIIPNWQFGTAFMGSELFGEALLEFPKISHVFCGHSHQARRCRKQHLQCTSIGSTYREKQYEVLDL
ncbi:MAG: metallophosphoesterase [Phycisphaerales bacterium]|nr:metallophosphoesterase [Phycisphaerales bacterium]